MRDGERIAKACHGHAAGPNHWMACCPAHDDRNPSLSITERDGKLLVNCKAGCPQSAVIGALKSLSLWPEAAPRQARQKQPLGPVVSQYLYTDENGVVLFCVSRHLPKDFRQWRPDGKGGWNPGLGSTRRVLYRLPEVVEAAIVFVVEGEKDVESLRAAGFAATCCPMGAGKWRDEFNPYFSGKSVVVIPDGDKPGLAHARQVIRGIRPVASQVILLDLEDAKDISEWFEKGHSEVELIAVLEEAWQEAPHG